MARREVIEIDEELCDGCGACVPSCAEGAIQVVDGKARLAADVLCDGLGACLGECPRGALRIVTREAEAFDEEVVAEHLARLKAAEEPAPAPALAHGHGPGGGCPGSRMIQLAPPAAAAGASAGSGEARPSELRQWPIQLHLVSPQAPYYQGADLLLAADCTAYALGDFHREHLKGKALAIACPKLDAHQEVYVEKLAAMIDQARVDTITVLIMQVPCCSGLLHLVQQAVARAQREVPVKAKVVGLGGEILSDEWVSVGRGAPLSTSGGCPGAR